MTQTAKVNELSWIVGGAQGSGVDSSATVFARAAASGGLHVYGKREYYSNIMGEHSYFQVRACSRPIRSHVDTLNLLATFDAETAFRHARNVIDDGAIIYDSALAGTKLDDVPTIEARLRADLQTYLVARGLGFTLQDLLKSAADRGVTLVPLPYASLLTQVADENHIDQLSKISRMVNMFAVAASFGILGYDYELMAKALRDVFRSKAEVAEMNVRGARKAYDLVRGKYDAYPYRLEPIGFNGERRALMTGAQAIGLGKVLGGMRVQTYYPITPASDESEYIEANQIVNVREPAADPAEEESDVARETGSVLVMQTEDEIAAVTMAIGAALTGARSATCTSGPGFCLMMEGIGWAGINEVPLVITLYQRAGPSTGMPTRHEQGDLRFALHAGHGDSPRIILASGDFEEAFHDGAKAFNWAERYQTTVIHLVDKALANSNGTMPIFDPDQVRIDRGELITDGWSGRDPYKRFAFTESGVSPRALLGHPGTMFWNTGDEHDEKGHITEDPVLRNLMMEKRDRKLDLAAREISESDKVNFFGDRTAETVVVSWGSTKGALLDAIDALEREGIKLGFLQIRLANPFPVELVTRALARAKSIVNVEMNFGAHMGGLIREKTGIEPTHHILKYNGRPMSSTELAEALRVIAKGKAPRKQVLTYGV
ncbi:MAG: 2-oxoacid:acceptor oxidoreductase subunit alpha [Methanobacteriota archaeon]|nr:MAG: 2-oxoacid:acceptor oxidoreductase subunit alpha [Euryarchaeota archaeon]